MKFVLRFATRAFRKGITKLLNKMGDKFGSTLVSGMADTSSDAPNAFHKPKRDVYSSMVENQEKH